MIIKTFSRTSSNMHDIVHYIADRDKAPEQPLQIYRNLPSAEIESITQAFEENLSFQTPQNKLTAYHDILSFHPLDVPQLSHDIIYDLVQQYITLRAPKSLWFGQIHTDQEHPHVHLLLSGNEYHSRKASRISRPAFYQLRVDLEQYQQEHFPQLTHSIHYEKMRTYPLHLLYSHLKSAYEHAQNKETFWNLAHKALEGKAVLDTKKQQIFYLGKHYLLTDIGIDLTIFDQMQELQHIRELSIERERNASLDITR